MNIVSKVVCGLSAVCAVVGSASGETATLPVGGAAIHLDASDRSTMTIEKVGNVEYVSEWRDASGGTRVAATPSGASRPFLSKYGDMTVMDFGTILIIDGTAPSTTDGIGGYMLFNQGDGNIREVFIVAEERSECFVQNKHNFILCHTTPSIYDFHRGVDGRLFNDSYAAAAIRNGLIEVDNSRATTSTFTTEGFHLYHFRTTGNVRMNSLCNERSGKYGGFVYAEIIIYDEVLTDDQASQVSDYLKVKWGEKGETFALTIAQPESDVLAAPQFDVEPDEDGRYADGTVVSVTVGVADPQRAEFVRWFGDVPSGHETDNPVSVTMNGNKTLIPFFRLPWNFTDETKTAITDGYWVFPVTGEPDALVLGRSYALGKIPIVDFTYGVNAGTVVGTVDGWFCDGRADNRSLIEEIRFPDTMTKIAPQSMRTCSNLKKVTLPKDVAEIGGGAFWGCASLTEVEPSLLPPTVNHLWHGVFNACTGLRCDVKLQNRKLVFEDVFVSEHNWAIFYGSGIASMDLSETRVADTPNGFVRECPNIRQVKYPATLKRLGEASHYGCGSLVDIQFQSYPTNFNTRTDLFGSTPSGYHARIVYQKGNADWEAYIAGEKANGNFVAWEDAGDATNTYLNAFADQWKPVGYIVVHKGERWGNVGKWFVPHNFNAGMKVLVR